MIASPIIVWEKWKDPYGSDDTTEINEMISEIIKQNLENDDEDEDENNEGDQKNIARTVIKGKIPMMMTPIGLIPYTENTAAGHIFNFWTGHSNFNITKSISDIIEATDGVETLDVFTRYRFRVSFGKAFKDSDIMRTINKNVYEYLT